VGQFRQFVEVTGYQTEAEKTGEGATVYDYVAKKWTTDPRFNWRTPGFKQGDDHPVTCLSWNDAQAFCAWLSKKEGKKYTLPTEAQWEYCCRAGSQTMFSFGGDATELPGYAWHRANASLPGTQPVGKLKPNTWGLYDMDGNVREWVADWFAENWYANSPREDPRGPAGSPLGCRLLRGSSTWSFESDCRAACRHPFGPHYRNRDHGFRVACEVPIDPAGKSSDLER
jgi:formylglycine-generating enzyme required for sulfatase activity